MAPSDAQSDALCIARARRGFACRGLLASALSLGVCFASAAGSPNARPKAHAGAQRPSPAAIRGYVESRLRDVRACYELALAQTGDAPGLMRFTWNIDDKGAAVDIEFDEANSTIADPSLKACISDRLKSWTFPPARKGKLAPASYPFKFSH